MKDNQYITLKKKIDFNVSKLNNCCEIGCSHCCYQLIEVFDFEIQTIKNAINKLDDEKKSIIKENLESWFTFFNKNTPNDKVLNKQDSIDKLIGISKLEKHKCPLLIDNKCSIYSNRPLACRIHVVENDPELCKEDPYRAPSSESFFINQQVLQDVKQTKKYYLTYLPYVVSEVIHIEQKIKPIKKLNLK